MPSSSSSSVDDLRASLLELLNACPVEHCNPPDCPLFLLRKMNPRQRLEWFLALDRADLEYLAAYHYACMNVRLGASR
jgi:hypothetical protein